ncbi:uncharacterized protein BDW43DRAFT_277194 [Aspergillus alliaceus]|uniref:uncharacterized protein n=1 Tax=Petromyces alliaceus TaxID=209559 RepID=UPI0012A6A68F|nr:uncharacterized protein BDW43DRAFT_277194 [Aspergillus alliaceus]KAB8233052.1 hypothetical protein BDW43DRAFT_277194 [Aspergillus alliaceus]
MQLALVLPPAASSICLPGARTMLLAPIEKYDLLSTSELLNKRGDRVPLAGVGNTCVPPSLSFSCRVIPVDKPSPTTHRGRCLDCHSFYTCYLISRAWNGSGEAAALDLQRCS